MPGNVLKESIFQSRPEAVNAMKGKLDIHCQCLRGFFQAQGKGAVTIIPISQEARELLVRLQY